MKALKFLILGFFVAGTATYVFACGGVSQPVYDGQIRYWLNPSNPLECTTEITFNFDINELKQNDSIWVNWGDGNIEIIYATDVHLDSLASLHRPVNPIFTHTYVHTHTYAAYPPNGFYPLGIQNQYCLGFVNNIAGGNTSNLPYYMEAEVVIDSTAGFSFQSPVFNPLTLVFGDFTSCGQDMLMSVPDGDSVSFVMDAPQQFHNTPAPLYQSPDQYCTDLGVSSSVFTLNAQTGAISWTNPCTQGVYSVVIKANSYRNGRFVGSSMRYQNIFVELDQNPSGVSNVANSRLQIYPNPATDVLQGNLNAVKPGDNRLSIFSAEGSLVIKDIPVNNNHFELGIASLAPGIYFIRSANGQFTSRFIKQ